MSGMALPEVLELGLLVIAVLAMAAFCSRLCLQRGAGSGGFLEILDRAYLGPSRQVVLLAIGGKVVLLGLSDKRLQMLAEMSRAELGEPRRRPPPPLAYGYGEALRRVFRRRQGSEDQG